jgi:hypothetical protein
MMDVRVFSCKNHISPQMMDREGTYCSSSGELYDFDLRRHELSIIWVVI